ncbi:MAG: TetR/AcrR family transcriptional regulator [Clostridia bacterium]|nr:TetR/AcrR family transcriptional regulator [Clostridia bacterium]
MQYLKDDVKENIIKAALAEFIEKGYQDSSMRIIARNANIVMGNIYRYFDNKEALFNALMGPVYDQIAGTCEKVQHEIEELQGPWEDEQAMTLIKQTYEQILKNVSGRGMELLILLDKSGGSRYEGTKKELIEQIRNILEIRLLPEMHEKDVFILYVVASAFVEGICVILRECGDHDRREALIGSLSTIMLCQISKRV